jgi:hypothetical protein
MRTSRPIEVQGRFLCVAVTQTGAWRFIATDPAVQDINGAIPPSPAEAQRVAGLLAPRHSRSIGGN